MAVIKAERVRKGAKGRWLERDVRRSAAKSPPDKAASVNERSIAEGVRSRSASGKSNLKSPPPIPRKTARTPQISARSITSISEIALNLGFPMESITQSSSQVKKTKVMRFGKRKERMSCTERMSAKTAAPTSSIVNQSTRRE